jgi:hypothetical protein
MVKTSKTKKINNINFQFGVVLEESASALTQGHFGIGGEGRFKPRP